jgi:hypothetical protein
MKKPAFIPPNNPVRAWSRRIVRGVRNRPDVQILQLQRRVEVLEGIADLSSRVRPWTAELIEALAPRQFAEVPLERIGSAHDGGYVLPVGLPQSVSGVVSIGVGDNNDVDFQLAEAGLRVHAWDHTVDALPSPHPSITFHRTGLGDPASSPEVKTLAQIADDSFGHGSGDLLLLLDAEGAEWDALGACSDETLGRFSVIGIELHDLGNLILDPTGQLPVLQRLNAHFAPVAVHANNHCAVWELPGLDLPDALEVTYVNRTLKLGDGSPGNCPVT